MIRGRGSAISSTRTTPRRSASRLEQRFIPRHRLKKVDPERGDERPGEADHLLSRSRHARSRSARRCSRARAGGTRHSRRPGYRNAFRVELLPAGASPLDIRYNMINWVHRSTRGWSYGGERGRSAHRRDHQGRGDAGIAARAAGLDDRRGIAAALQERRPRRRREIQAWALQRMRQLAAHEVGHTLGFGHNYYDSDSGRISVMDYPAPLVTLRPDGTLDASKVYADGIGAWDKVAIAYGYQDFPQGHQRSAGAAADPRSRLGQGPALPDQPGHRRQSAGGPVVQRHQRRGRTRPDDGGAEGGAEHVRRERHQARHADGADRGDAGAALSPSPLSGGGGGERAGWHPLHLCDAWRRPGAVPPCIGPPSSAPRSVR